MAAAAASNSGLVEIFDAMCIEDSVDDWVQQASNWLDYTANVIQSGQGHEALQPLPPADFKVEQVEAYFDRLPPIDANAIQRLVGLRSRWFTYRAFMSHYDGGNGEHMWNLFSTCEIWKFLNRRADYGFRMFSDYGRDLFYALINYSGVKKSIMLARLMLWLNVSVYSHSPFMHHAAGQEFVCCWYDHLCGLPRSFWSGERIRSDLYYYIVLRPAQISCTLLGLSDPTEHSDGLSEPTRYFSLHELLQAVRVDMHQYLSRDVPLLELF